MNAGRKLFYFLSASIFILSSHRKSSLLLLVVMPFYQIVNLPSGFDLLPIVKPAFLFGGEIQKITSRPMRLPVIPEQVKGTLDVRHLLRIKTGFVTITGKTDDTVNGLAEDVACFKQQETEAANNMPLPCNPVFEPRCFLRMRSLPTVKFRLVLGLQFHPFTVMVVLHGLDFTL